MQKSDLISRVIRLVVCAGAVAIFLPSLCAEPALPLRVDLPSAIEMALARNYRIQVERFGPEIADARLLEQRGIFDPVLELEYRRREQSERADPLLPDLRTSLLMADFYRAGITGLLPWGMRYDLGLETRNSRDADNAPDDRFDTSAGLTLTQPMLRGFGPGPTMARIRVARIGQALGDWDLRARLIDTVSETILVYNDLHFSELNLEVANHSRSLAAQLLADNQKRSEVGVMSPLDITEARAELASREEAVIVAERQLRDNENFLKRLVTDDLEALLDRRVELLGVPRLTLPPGGVRDSIRQALDLRPEYRRALLDLQQRQITIVLERSEGLPRLDLVASFGANGIDDSFGRSIDRLVEEQRTEWSVGAAFAVPLPNRAARGRIAAARLEIARALVDLKRLEQDIIVEIDNATGQIETTRQRIIATTQALELSRERLRAEEERLKAGASTTFLLLEAQRALAEAEAAQLRARTDYNKAIVECDRSIGTTLERHGVSLGY